MTVALIVEGSTDFEVLKAVLQSRPSQPQVVLLQPRGDRTSGWPGVKRYLQQKGRALGALVRFGGYACLFVQVDADVVGTHCPGSVQQQWQQAEARLRGWAGVSSWPERVHPVVPVMCLETWIAAATPAAKGRTSQMECWPCAQVIAAMPSSEGAQMAAKNTAFYRDTFAPRVAKHWKENVVAFCPVGAGQFEQVLQACGL